MGRSEFFQVGWFVTNFPISPIVYKVIEVNKEENFVEVKNISEDEKIKISDEDEVNYYQILNYNKK